MIAYKCRCGMCYTEQESEYLFAQSNEVVCQFCGDILHPTEDWTRPVFDGGDSNEIPEGEMEPTSIYYGREHGYRFGPFKRVHGNWRCSCGLTYVDNLYDFLNLDNRGSYRCRVCATQMKLHAVSPKERTIEEVEDAMNSGWFDPNAKPISSEEFQNHVDDVTGVLRNICKDYLFKDGITWGIGNDGHPYTLKCDYSGKHPKKEYIMDGPPVITNEKKPYMVKQDGGEK